MARYLVTGGCGFIGSHLADALLARGDEVRILDDLSTGTLINKPPGAQLVVGDVADREAVARAMADIDGCFHLAAVASVARTSEDWIGTNRVNLAGSVAVFDAARRHRTPVVYASSAAVYGKPSALPLAETASTEPLSAYGADKLATELHARVATSLHGVPTIGLRFFNVYGPRQDPSSPYSGVISRFCHRLSQGKPVTVFGDGRQVRDFVYIADAVRALAAGMDRPAVAPAVINVCTGRMVSVLTLANIIAALCNEPCQIEASPARPGDIGVSYGDPTRLRRVLGVERSMDLVAGLRETLAALRRTSNEQDAIAETGIRVQA
jgi:UDP-glucose 4-epimerase